MIKQFNEQQTKAIEAKGNNVLVSASAGTGKTALLVERIIRMVCEDNIDVTQLLILTFTEAAAAELKLKIEKELKSKNNTNQLAHLDDAYISTFHAMCNRLLKENGKEYQFKKVINIADKRILQDLKQEAFNKLYDEVYQEPEFKNLEWYFNEKLYNFKSLFEVLYNTNSLVLKNGGYDLVKSKLKDVNPKDLLNIIKNLKLKKDDKENIGDLLELYKTTDIDSIFKNVCNQMQIALTIRDELVEIIKKIDGLDDTVDLNDESEKSKKVEVVKPEREFVERLAKSVENDYLSLKENYENYGKQSLKKFTDNITKDMLKGRVADLKLYDAIKEYNNAVVPVQYMNVFKHMLADNQKNAKILLEYAQKLNAYYFELKKETGYLEFDDLEFLTMELLKDQKIVEKLSKQFHEVLVDEYQDTSFIQEQILEALSNGKNLFMVGDVKQSIYGFRDAKPEIFINKFNEYKNDTSKGQVVELKQNYRSKKNVLSFSNFIFKNLFSEELGGIVYDEKNELIIGTKDQAFEKKYTPQLIFNHYKGYENKLSSKEKAYLSALSAAKIIKEKVDNNEASLGDFTILTRTRTHGTTIKSVFKKQGIKLIEHGSGGFFTNYVIIDLMNMLRFIDNPHNDVYLAGVLHSLFFNLTEQDIFDITKIENPEQSYLSLFSKLEKSMYKEVYETLNDLKHKKYELSTNDLIDYIYENTSYKENYYAYDDYENFILNILNFKKLINDSLSYYSSLTNLLDDIESSKPSETKDDTQIYAYSKDDDVVNLMTIHNAKGLQFRYVIFIDFDKKENYDISKTRPVLIDDQLYYQHFNTEYKYTINNVNGKDTYYKLFTTKFDKLDKQAEELRLLYVALTRAEEQLYIIKTFSTVDKIDENGQETDNAFKNSLKYEEASDNWVEETDKIINLKSLGEFILKAIQKHKDGEEIAELMGSTINDKNEIYSYSEDNEQPLFEVTINNNITTDDVVIEDKDNNYKNDYPYEVEEPLKELIKLNDERPSYHGPGKIDFKNIIDKDTYKQGSNYHYIMEEIDFNNYEKHLEELKEKYPLVEQPVIDGLTSFDKDDFFKVINDKDNTYHKEYSFLYSDDERQFNGIIDLYVESDDTIYIIDYKTDKASSNELLDRYKEQLLTYKKVVEQSTNKPVVCKIYAVREGKFVDVE